MRHASISGKRYTRLDINRLIKGITAMRTPQLNLRKVSSNLSLNIHNPEQLPPINLETLQRLLRLNPQPTTRRRKNICISLFQELDTFSI